MPEEHEEKDSDQRENDDMGPFTKEPVKALSECIPTVLQRTVDPKDDALIDIFSNFWTAVFPSKTAPTV